MRGEAAVGVDVLDPGPDVQRVVVLLDPLVGVERLAVTERPLALATGPAGRAGGGRRGRRGPGRAGVLLTAIAASSVVSAVPRGRADARRPARGGPRTTVSETAGADRAPETERSGGVSKPDRSRCARGRSRRGDGPRSGGRQRRSCSHAPTPCGGGPMTTCGIPHHGPHPHRHRPPHGPRRPLSRYPARHAAAPRPEVHPGAPLPGPSPCRAALPCACWSLCRSPCWPACRSPRWSHCRRRCGTPGGERAAHPACDTPLAYLLCILWS